MIVTEMKKRRHRLTALYVDGEPVELDTETLLLSGIRVGDTLSREELADLQERSLLNRAYERVLYLLEYRAHSRGELYAKLLREYPEEAACAALERAEALGLIDDEAYAAELARSLSQSKGYGAHRISMELYRRHIDREVIDRVLSELDADPVEQVMEQIQRKYHEIPTDQPELSKLIAAMVRRGYEYGQVRTALRRLAEEIEEDEMWPSELE